MPFKTSQYRPTVKHPSDQYQTARRAVTDKMHGITITTNIHVNRMASWLSGNCCGGTERDNSSRETCGGPTHLLSAESVQNRTRLIHILRIQYTPSR